MNEIDRIKKVYDKRRSSGKDNLYSVFNPTTLFTVHQRDHLFVDALLSIGMRDLSDKKILDVGCGSGNTLRCFTGYGVWPENCFGIDLLQDRIVTAKRLSPNISFTCTNAERMDFEPDFFDIICSITVFSSILDKDMKKGIANQMVRVLKKGGVILWYDYFVNNPRNPDCRGIKDKDIHALFPQCDIHLKRTTLAPPIARRIVPYSWLMCYLIEKLKVFNTHYFGYFIKR